MRKTKRKRRSPAPALLALLLALLAALVLLRLDAREDALRGSWEADQHTVYEFDGRGHGALCLPLNRYAFRYSLRGGVLRLDFAADAVGDTQYRCSVRGEILELESEAGLFTLKKSIEQTT